MKATTRMPAHSRRLAAVLAFVLALTACGGGGDDPQAGEEAAGETEAAAGETEAAAGESETVRMTVEASAIPAFVAADRDLFEGVDVEVSEVGYDQVESLLVAGDTDVAWISPLETAQFAAEGQDFRYFSTAGAQNMYNGVVVAAENADQYDSIESLQGKSLGIPGFGTGTWTAFEAFTKAYYGIEDPRTAFDIVTADSGALLALVEGGEVDAALLFSGSSAAARGLPQFETIFSFTEAMQEETGQPLVVNGAVARADWLEANAETASAVQAGLDAAVAWMMENPSEFEEGGEYADLAEAAGWLSAPETTSTVLDLLTQGEWYLTSEDYTDEWIDAIYQLLEDGGEAIVDEVPPREEVFLEPGALGGEA